MAYRTPNYTHEQKLYFLQRIQGVVNTVQDNRKDTNSTIQRNKAWAELLAAFNAAFPDRPPSTVHMLKTLWKRMKVETRQALVRRREQLAAGLGPTSLSEIQQEVTSMLPNLIIKVPLDSNSFGATKALSGYCKQETGGNSGSDQEDEGKTHVDGSMNRMYISTMANSSTSCMPEDEHPPPPSVTPQANISSAAPSEPQLTTHVLELSEREHFQKMRVLLAQEQVMEEKRKALKQKERAYRYKKLYYRTKLQNLGAELQSSTDED